MDLIYSRLCHTIARKTEDLKVSWVVGIDGPCTYKVMYNSAVMTLKITQLNMHCLIENVDGKVADYEIRRAAMEVSKFLERAVDTLVRLVSE
jgi:hypothetical protein